MANFYDVVSSGDKSYHRRVGDFTPISAPELAAVAAGERKDILAEVYRIYQLDVAPYTLYQSDGSAMVALDETTRGEVLSLDPATGLTAGGQALTANQAAKVRSDIGSDLPSISRNLAAGLSSVLALIGDSTGNETTEHLYLTAQAIAAANPSHRVEYRLWDNAAQDFLHQTPIQEGISGRRGVTGGGVQISYVDIAEWSGDIDIRVLASHPTWTTGITSDSTLISRFGSGGARSFRFMAGNSAGNLILKLGWTADLTNEITVSATGFAPTAGEVLWLRSVLDVDNGGGGYTVTFYSSTDGNTWTQRSQTVTASGTTSVAKTAATNYELGSRGNGTAAFNGTIYAGELRDGIAGGNLLPVGLDEWRQVTGLAPVFSGSPTVYVINGSNSGSAISYFNDSTRRPKMTPVMWRGAMILSTGHNETHGTSAAAVSDWLTYVKGRATGADLFVTAQNPQLSPATKIESQQQFVAQFVGQGRRAGYGVIDAYGAFVRSSNVASLVSAVDGVHPTAAGSAVWSQVERLALGV